MKCYVSEKFKKNLPDKLRKDLERKHTRFAFGSKFIPGYHTYTPALFNQELAIYDIESIFAFDVLALNMDRRNKKPNILLENDRYYLIDHEHTFVLPTNNFVPRQLLNKYRFKNHIFYEVLSRKTKYGHKPEFGAFRELFHRLNIDKLDKYAEELKLKGYETGDCFVIKQYLQELKQDISYFMNVLGGVIQ